MNKFFTLILLLLIGFKLNAQKTDTLYKKYIKLVQDTDKVMTHSPTKASILSMILPGAGQMYNKKYWKIPIVWTGIGITGYFISYNHKQYRHYKNAYIYKTDNNPETVDEYPNADPALIYQIRDYYRDNRDISWVALAIIYVLNILDATVDAYFYDFDLNFNKNFSISVSPQNFYVKTYNFSEINNYFAGLSLKIKIK